MRIALFGPPGAGKGSQAERLINRRRLAHISTGNMIRQSIREKTPIGLEAKAYVASGKLVPDPLVRQLAEAAISGARYDRFVLDGYPRTVQQAEWLTTFLEAHGAPLHAVLSFVVPDEIIVDRLSKRRVHRVTGENYHLDHKPPPPDLDPALIMQRDDDQPSAVRNRLREYRERTEPVEAYYRMQGILVEIDAVGDFETVYGRIEEALNVAC